MLRKFFISKIEINSSFRLLILFYVIINIYIFFLLIKYIRNHRNIKKKYEIFRHRFCGNYHTSFNNTIVKQLLRNGE